MTTDAPRDATPDVTDLEAYTRLEREMTAMKTAIGDLSLQIANAATDVGAVARSQARRGLKHARANVDSVMSDASGRIGAVAGAAQAQAASIADTLQEVIEERPLSTVALA